MTSPQDPGQRWILDTHVALDWLLFDDPRTRFLAPALSGGQALWMATVAMQREFELVLARSIFDSFTEHRGAAAETWQRFAHLVDAPASSRWRCTDPDDQVFVDLAAAHPGSVLFTRDKALRRLAPKLRTLGCIVSPPEIWSAHREGQPSPG